MAVLSLLSLVFFLLLTLLQMPPLTNTAPPTPETAPILHAGHIKENSSKLNLHADQNYFCKNRVSSHHEAFSYIEIT